MKLNQRGMVNFYFNKQMENIVNKRDQIEKDHFFLPAWPCSRDGEPYRVWSGGWRDRWRDAGDTPSNGPAARTSSHPTASSSIAPRRICMHLKKKEKGKIKIKINLWIETKGLKQKPETLAERSDCIERWRRMGEETLPMDWDLAPSLSSYWD